jgi:hypothetical protein
MHKSLLWAALIAVSSVGCVAGSEGDSGKLRFGQVYIFAESTDFKTPIAAGQPMPLGLQATTKEGLLEDYKYLDGSLEVKDASGNPLEVEKQGTGRFQAVFPKPGSYTLLGKNGKVEDSLSVTAAEQTGLRIAKQWFLHGTGTDKSCKAKLPADGKLPALKKNQTLTLTVVPQSADGAALLGLLDLKAEAQGAALTKNAALTPGSYTVAQETNGIATHAAITFTDQKTNQTFVLELDLNPLESESCVD